MDYSITEFDTDVIERSRKQPVLVDFWAEWCGPCRILGPVLEKLADESGGRWILAKLDTERFPDISRQYNIRSIPNVKLFMDGRPVAEFTGALPESTIREWLRKYIPGDHDAEIARAKTLLTGNRATEAKNILSTVLEKEPQNHEARVLLAASLLYDDPRVSERLVDPIEEDSRQYETASAIRHLAYLLDRDISSLPDENVKPWYLKGIDHLRHRDFAGALEQFIRVIQESRFYDDDGARKTCVAIFKFLGEEHEITLQYRRAFDRSLY